MCVYDDGDYYRAFRHIDVCYVRAVYRAAVPAIRVFIRHRWRDGRMRNFIYKMYTRFQYLMIDNNGLAKEGPPLLVTDTATVGR